MEEKDVFEIKKSKKWIFGLLFILILLGGACYITYTFIKNNDPKKVLVNSTQELITEIATSLGIENINKINIDSKASIEITGKERKIYDIINKINLDIYFGYNEDYYLDLKGTYNNEELGNITIFSKNNDNYISTDKVIKIDKGIDYRKVLEYEKNAFIKAYEKIELKSKYVKSTDRRLREIKIENIKEISTIFFDELLNNKEFLDLINKTTNLKKESLKKYQDYIENSDVRIYLSMLKNRFIKLEINNNKDKLIIERNKNIISIKLYHDEIISNKLDITINEKTILLEYNNVEKSFNTKVKLDYKIDNNVDIKTKDTSNSVNYSKLKEEELLNLFKNNKGYISLMKDLKEEEN